MSNQQPTESIASSKPRLFAFLGCCYLIAQFLYCTLTVAHEYPMRPEQVVQIALDLMVVIGLFGLRKHVAPWLFWISFTAGLGLFAIRLHSDASWWTGHWSYSID